jgi:hypothetical protein
LLLAIDLHEDLINVERIAVTTVSPFETTSISSAKLDTPGSDGFVADTNASFGEQILDITIAKIESMVEPNRVTDDVGRKSVTLISIHHRIIDQQQLTCQYPPNGSTMPSRIFCTDGTVSKDTGSSACADATAKAVI